MGAVVEGKAIQSIQDVQRSELRETNRRSRELRQWKRQKKRSVDLSVALFPRGRASLATGAFKAQSAVSSRKVKQLRTKPDKGI